ncbi:hypothetical protein NMG60_11024862 [Bertholletia excelsa]
MAIHITQICAPLIVVVLGIGLLSNLSFGHDGHHPGSCASEAHEVHAHHSCDHGHHHQHGQHHHVERTNIGSNKLPEELAEEEDLKLYGFGSHQTHEHDHHHREHVPSEISGFGLWFNAVGCSLLVSLASLICLIILPLIFIQGKPSKTVVDSLAAFGAGAMLGDAFLHQLPHAFGGEHSHSHDYDGHHAHSHVASVNEHSHSHSHSLKDLSVGLSVLAGIVLFLLVEKIVRYVEENSRENDWNHGHCHHHRHHHHKGNKSLKDASDDGEKIQQQSLSERNGSKSEISSKGKASDGMSDDVLIPETERQPESLRKRNTGSGIGVDKPISDASNGSSDSIVPADRKETSQSQSNLVFGYLNLFSDGVHNFTDGMALGSAFLLHGSVGGWSRTLFLLAHELPQEVGDFGILVRSGFSVSKALFFNFLSALVAVAGTVLALLLGHDPGHSSLIEGFTAGGFIYIAVAGVLAEMNNGSSVIKSTLIQLTSLISGMAVALCISLVE